MMSGAGFRALRYRLGMSQAELAEMWLGTHQTKISEFEIGKTPITPEVAQFMRDLEAGKVSRRPRIPGKVSRRVSPGPTPAAPAPVVPVEMPPGLCGACLCVYGEQLPCGCRA